MCNYKIFIYLKNYSYTLSSNHAKQKDRKKYYFIKGGIMQKNIIYIAACVFTREHADLSMKIQDYIKNRFNAEIIRCCVENYNVGEFEESIKAEHRNTWKSTRQYKTFSKDDVMLCTCHNCAAIFEETQPEIERMSLWELILQDTEFVYKDMKGEKITLQDCWRSYDNAKEQEAVRSILKKMNIEIVELEENKEKTQFCGISTLQASPKRNLRMAPIRFVENAKGKFIPHSEEEKLAAMQEYSKKINTDKVISYCHYCHKGLTMTNKEALLLGELLFG